MCSVMEKFIVLLRWVDSHHGAPWIEGTQPPGESLSPLKDARRTYEALDARQFGLGLPELHIRVLQYEDLGKRASKSGRGSGKGYNHGYVGPAFLRVEFLRVLLGVAVG